MAALGYQKKEWREKEIEDFAKYHGGQYYRLEDRVPLSLFVSEKNELQHWLLGKKRVSELGPGDSVS